MAKRGDWGKGGEGDEGGGVCVPSRLLSPIS